MWSRLFFLSPLPPLRRHVDQKRKRKQLSSWHRPTAESRYHHTFFFIQSAEKEKHHDTHLSQSSSISQMKRSTGFRKTNPPPSLRFSRQITHATQFFFCSKYPIHTSRSKYHHPCMYRTIHSPKFIAWQHVAKSQPSQTPQSLSGLDNICLDPSYPITSNDIRF